ncbi:MULTISPECIES: hypothetical protein [Paenibacillus]|uniref:hypothetical protein n=1 Tax=Paenibacillus TaxID=44249 RepID=UPI002FE1164B
MGKKRLFIGFVLLAAVSIVIGLILYIRPTDQLDLRYTEISWKDKLFAMAETRRAELTLSERELNQLAKKALTEYLEEHDLPVTVTGAEFQLNGERLEARVHATWGALEAGLRAGYRMEFSAGKLTLTPEFLRVRRVELSPGTFGLEPIIVRLDAALPDVVKIKAVDFQEHSLKIRFALDWIELARYLEGLL